MRPLNEQQSFRHPKVYDSQHILGYYVRDYASKAPTQPAKPRPTIRKSVIARKEVDSKTQTEIIGVHNIAKIKKTS